MATTRPEPLVHREKGGTSSGFVDFYRVLIALEVDTIVTGHGELVTKADLQERMTEVQEKQAKIAAMVGHGQPLEDIKSALRESASANAAPGGRGPAIASLTEIIYAEVKNQCAVEVPCRRSSKSDAILYTSALSFDISF